MKVAFRRFLACLIVIQAFGRALEKSLAASNRQ